jgi:hypothetical protein
MATTPKALDGKIAVSKDSGIKPLGFLTWFSIPDDSVSLRRLKQQLTMNGLPMSLAPKDTKALHVFQRAMREQEGRRRDEHGNVRETTVALVDETPNDCVYQISVLKRDVNERVIDYPKAMRVIFNKKTEEISARPFVGEGALTRAEGAELAEQIQEFYEKNGTRVTGARVRTVVRNFIREEADEKRGIEGLSGENLRGKAGGIYFVLAANEWALEALSHMLSEVYNQRAYLHFVPMADGASEREIIQRHHVANTRQEMKEALGELRGLLKSDRERAPRSDVVANKFAQFHALQRRAAKYREVLGDEQEEIADMAKTLRKQLDKLAS